MRERTIFELIVNDGRHRLRLNQSPKIEKNLIPFIVRPIEPYRIKKIQIGKFILELFDMNLKSQTMYDAIEAMKEQDAFMNEQKGQDEPKSKVMMSIETYEHMQNDPEKAREICSRIFSNVEDPDEKVFNDLTNFLKKW
jgi:hypothetical protein